MRIPVPILKPIEMKPTAGNLTSVLDFRKVLLLPIITSMGTIDLRHFLRAASLEPEGAGRLRSFLA